jgi:hypothetical protein
MLKKAGDPPENLKQNLRDQAENLFGAQRARELEPELEVMAEQLAILRASPLELLDEP